jgi:16S rRNA (uracil1498-N3)-methyltransferase
MSAPRFFCDVPLMPQDVGRDIDFPPTAARHAAQALRLRVGDRIALFTGRGGEFAAVVSRIDKRSVAARVERFDPIEREAVNAVTLVQSVIAADMMDLVVRKAVELGAAAIVPVLAVRSQRMPPERATKRVAHWQQIAVAACEQCGRNRIPTVAGMRPLEEWLDNWTGTDGVAVMLSTEAKVPLAATLRNPPPRAVLIGPEGGFTAGELEHAGRRGVHRAHFGPRTLRSETAALAALAAIEALAACRAPA